MLSIGAGAQQEVIAFIEQLGVRNVIVEAREAPDGPTLEKVRKLSAGLTLPGPARHPGERRRSWPRRAPRKRVMPVKMLPQAAGRDADGVRRRAGLRRRSPACACRGPVLRRRRRRRAAPWRCSARRRPRRCSATEDPVGRYVKVNQQWFRGDRRRGPAAGRRRPTSPACPAQDRNNVIYVPLHGAPILRLEDAQSFRKDEIDGIYLTLVRRRRHHRGGRRRARPARRRAPRRRRLQRRSCPPNCWPSSSARGASSRWSWWRSRRSRCWSAASGS